MGTFGFSYGAFGELLQGVLPNDRHFLVTLPINIKSKAYFNHQPSKKFIVYPDCKEKIKIFINLFCNYYGISSGGYLSIDSEIPIGKGLSSSTADLIAAFRALSKAFNINYSPECVEKLMRQIEPSDGLLYDGVVAYYHKEVSLLQKFNYYPDLIILGVDEGGKVDTIEYNRIKQNPSIEEKNEFKQLLSQFIQAITKKDLKTIGSIATRSTELNQKYNYKPSFNNILEINYAINGLGLICAHSGTYVGILLNKLDIDLNAKINYCQQVCSKLNKKMELFHTVEEVSYAAMC